MLKVLSSRTAVVTAELLRTYKEMIENTAVDLDELLRGIDDRMKSGPSHVSMAATDSSFDDNEAVMKEERASIQQCLKICENVSAHIDQVKANSFKDISTTPSEHRQTIKQGSQSLTLTLTLCRHSVMTLAGV